MVTLTPRVTTELEGLRTCLQRHRELVVWKLNGVSEADARRPMLPSGTSLLGLVKHLGGVEYNWFCSTFGRETEPMPFDENDPEADLRAEPHETIADVVAFYQRAWAASDQVLDELSLDTMGTSWFGDPTSLRWALIRMVEETARHCGHADIVRELIDGSTGWRPDA